MARDHQPGDIHRETEERQREREIGEPPLSEPPADHGREPDEPHEGMLTRANEQGGFEPRITSDSDDPPLGEQIAGELDYDEKGRKRRVLGGTLPPPV